MFTTALHTASDRALLPLAAISLALAIAAAPAQRPESAGPGAASVGARFAVMIGDSGR